MTFSIKELDRLTRVAPLGLRFRDVASGALVGDGLNVRVYPLGRSTASVAAVANRKGVYVLHHAAGLRTLEGGRGDREFWDGLPPRKSFVIEVSDGERRFQPFHFTEQLPIEGIYQWIGAAPASPPLSPPSALLAAPTSIPLYSSPVRSVPAGMAVLRADLWDAFQDAPAAWAVVEGYLDDQLIVRGIADEQGRIALIFPYPAPRSFVVTSPPASPASSPPAATGPALTEQVWPISLRARYTSDRPVLSPPDPFEQKPELPDLRFTLSQPPATIWKDAAFTEPLLEVSLRYGRELVLKSETITTSPPLPVRRSVLFISPAVSPP